MSSPLTAASLLRIGATVPPRRRLFCLPFAGGGAATYRLWARSLPGDVEVVVVQLPGRQPPLGEQPLDAIEDMVRAARPAIDSASDLPYAIFGHSMGALVAFELTVALEHDGARSPSHLFVSARRPPDEPDPSSPVHGLPDAEFLDQLQRRYNAVPEVVRQEPDLLALLLPVLRADVRAIETYAPLSDRKVRCPVEVYGGLDDHHPRPDQLPGWQRVAEREIGVRLFAGDHFYVTTQRDALTADIATRWTDASVPVEQA